jgi:hypothetical protein
VEDRAAELGEAIESRRRLARYRRILVALLVTLATALFVLTRFEVSALRRPIALLGIAWFGLWLPTVRVMMFERYTQRLIDRLSASRQPSKRI